LTEKPFERLAKGSYFLSLSSIVNMGMGALFWFILARMVEPAYVGQAMVVIALITSVIGFSGIGVQAMTSKYISECNARRMPGLSRKVFSVGMKVAILVSGTAALSIGLLSENIATAAYKDPGMAILLAFAAFTYLPAHTIVMALIGVFQGSQRMEYVLFINLLFQLVRLSSAAALVLYGLSSFGILTGFALGSSVAASIAYFYLTPKMLPKQIEGSLRLRDLLKFSGFNYIDAGVRSVAGQIAVLLLGTYNFELAAFFGVTALISKIMSSVIGGVSSAILPTASEEWAKGNKHEFGHIFNAAVRIPLVITGFAVLVLMIAPNAVLSLIGKSYVEASAALRILVISSLIVALDSIMLSLLNATGRSGLVARIGLVSSAVTIVLTVILIPLFRLEGAAVALLVGSISSLILSATLLKYREGLSLRGSSVIKPAVSIIAGLLIGILMLGLLNNPLLAIITAIATYCGFSLVSHAIKMSEVKKLLGILLHTAKI